MKPFKLDRTSFKSQTIEEASHCYGHWEMKSHAERLSAAFYLNSVAYNFNLDNPPRMDRTFFKMKGRL
jgi:hypothetical protein